MKKDRNTMLLKMAGFTEQQIYNFKDELTNSGMNPKKYLKNASKNIETMESHPEHFNKKSDKYMLESLKLFSSMSQTLVSGKKPVAKDADAVKETYEIYKQKDQEFKKLSGFKKFMARILPSNLYKPAALLKEKNEMEKLLTNDIEIPQEIRDEVDDKLNREKQQSKNEMASNNDISKKEPVKGRRSIEISEAKDIPNSSMENAAKETPTKQMSRKMDMSR